MCITEDKLVESYGKATPRERFHGSSGVVVTSVVALTILSSLSV